jgi:hypothetical protein
MAEFTNEFQVVQQVTELKSFSIKYDGKYDSPRSVAYKIAGHVARMLTNEMRAPVASWGSSLVAEKGVSLPGVVTVLVKLDGVPTDVEVTIKDNGLTKKGESSFPEAVKKFLNRKVDLILTENGYEQDGRRFYEKKLHSTGNSNYAYSQGIQVNAHVNENGEQTMIVDPVTQVKNKLNLLQALKKELEKKGISHWTQVGDAAEEINKAFRTRAYNLRSTYVEQRGEDLESNTYRFAGFDFSRGLKKDDNPRSPANFHSKYGRQFTLDQPVVKLIAHGGIAVDHIPELVKENPSLHIMKRYGVSADIQAKSQMDAVNRYYMTYELISPLVKSGFIDKSPTSVKIEDFGPVRLTLQGDFITVKSNIDFQQIYKKQKLLSPPQVTTIHLFSSENGAESAKKAMKVIVEIFKEFGLTVPPVKEKLDCPADSKQFSDTIVNAAKAERYTDKDLVLAITEFSSDDPENYVYNSIKARSIDNMFPVQFITEKQISKADEKGNLKTGLAQPLFLQIVAKCKGQPYGLQEGFAPSGTVFIGIDRHRDPFKKDAPLVTSVVVFDENGTYVCSATDVPADSMTVTPLMPLLRACIDQLKKVQGKSAKRIFAFTDTGIGTLWEQLMSEAKELDIIADEAGAKFAYVSADKGTRLRIYSGDPDDELSASKVSSFTAVTEMRNKSEFLTVTTEPIVMSNKEIGTPKSVLYTILKRNEDDLSELKRTLAKCVVWLCRHAWVSPASTRIPAPLYFANKVSRISADTGVAVMPEKSGAPLFL